ncbi:RsmB/NOP family class I SAM-dependent RNA methyltransferase [Aestuariibius sp. 2305UL40-4]|uniref:RsmB/NOP family class I SAM-dependent RNA methyltransferase n=1 Tax=Aestuariibius violaceus TaxID=3234132 RepID=UPI00345EE51F
MTGKPQKPGLAARSAAMRLLNGVTADGRLLSELIGAGALAALPPEDRARAQRLATATLRHLEKADRALKPFLRKAPPPEIRNILRLGLVEICEEGAASHAVVDACVEIANRGRRTRPAKGLVNAVLRKADPEAWRTRPPARLPRWLRDPLVAAYGKRGVAAMEAAHAAGAPLDLTAKGDPALLAQKLGGTLLPTGSVRLTDPGQVSTLPGFVEGEWWVQDAAAALPARILAPATGEKVIDLCAAPGGKTLQLAAAGADVLAVDKSADRLTRLTENLARTGLSARILTADALEVTETAPAILLDAPCSATGTIRRHPDLPYAKDGSDFAGLIALQAQLIDHAVTLLDPGGRLVFCTCSLLPDEGEVQIEEALARHPALRADRDALTLPGIYPNWITEEGGLRLRPDRAPMEGGWDGFYIACLRRTD